MYESLIILYDFISFFSQLGGFLGNYLAASLSDKGFDWVCIWNEMSYNVSDRFTESI